MKIRPVRAELFHAGRQTNGRIDRHDETITGHEGVLRSGGVAPLIFNLLHREAKTCVFATSNCECVREQTFTPKVRFESTASRTPAHSL